ncbi:MAG: EamA family transporter [Methylophilaceae bacterium]|nr:EamA family transporter [Methylophilaceae bacterium]
MLKPWILFVVAVLLDTLGTVLFKHGSNQLPQSNQLGWRGHAENILGALKRKEIALGVIVYIVEYIIWIGFLSTMTLSAAYPLSSVTIVLILLASWLFLGEKIGKNRWLGALLIISGMFLVGG